jgi:two-component system NtrC family sensor kinase
MASLFVVRGRDQGKHIPLDPRVYRIGRESTCDIRLLDSEASRVHAELSPLEGGQFLLKDLGSSNGTTINGHPIKQQPLAGGDRIEIGSTLLVFNGTTGRTTTRAGHDVDIIGQVDPHSPGLTREDASRIISSVASGVGFTGQTDGASDFSVLSGRPQWDRNLEVMYRTALAVGRTDSIPELLDRILRLVFDWVAADRGCVMLREGDSDRLRPAARCDRDIDGAPPARKGRIAISRTILDYVIERKEGVRTSDARDDIRFDAAHSIVQGGVREALCVPLQGRYAVVGALYVDTYTSPGSIIQSGYQARFTDEHLRLMTAIGYQAALAIEDTYYYSAMVQSERLAAMGQTIATLSHHIKNILQGMRGGSYLIEAGLRREDTAAVRRGWSIGERNQERISSLVMDMLTFSKEREPEKVDADLNETVADVIELMQTRAAELGVQLRFEPDPQLPTARFDPDALHRAVLNIVTNAIDAAVESDPASDDEDADDDADEDEYSGEGVDQAGRRASPKDEWTGDDTEVGVGPEQPTVMLPSAAAAIATAPIDGGHGLDADATDPALPLSGQVVVATSFDPEQGWTIAVRDSGPGISPEDREKIFSLFESKKGARGTGLGLPVSEKIMREHGGSIELAPAEMQNGVQLRGACFLLRLPLLDSPADRSGPQVTQTQAILPPESG